LGSCRACLAFLREIYGRSYVEINPIGCVGNFTPRDGAGIEKRLDRMREIELRAGSWRHDVNRARYGFFTRSGYIVGIGAS
jgi:hypothetical protein